MNDNFITRICCKLLLFLLVCFFADAGLGQSSTHYQLKKQTLNNGGVPASSELSLTGSVGQTSYSKAAFSNNYNLSPGFWGKALVMDFRGDKLLASDGAENDEFGRGLALGDDIAIVGAAADDNENGVDAGGVYIYALNGTSWTEDAKLLADDGMEEDNFGYSVALDGDYLVIGAPWTNDLADKSGAAYIFHRDPDDNWSQQAKLIASDGGPDNRFGIAVDISGGYVIVGAFFDDDYGTRSGSAYIFERDGGTWTEQTILQASDAAESDWFGVSVAIDGDMAAVGSRYDDNENGTDAGGVYIFSRDGESWSEQQKIIAPDGAEGDLFHTVNLAEGYLTIGAYNKNIDDTHTGAAYLYQYHEGPWELQQEITASDGQDGDYFGSRVAIYQNRMAISAYRCNDLGTNSGAIYLYEYEDSAWNETEKITAFDGEANDNFGLPVEINDKYLLAAARTDDDKGENSGSVYIYNIDTTNTTGIETDMNTPVPTTFELFQAYPNPFNPETRIRFNIPETGHVKLEIFNINGRRVATLTDQVYDAGQHAVTWRGMTSGGLQAASGMYFYRIRYRDQSITQKMLLLR